jgi:multidrug resistance efflux pump
VKKTLRIFVTLLIVGIAIALVGWRYRLYLTNPWTRDGQVRANVVQVAPRVSGPVVELPITDNQLVKAGQLLFRIDPRTYANSLEQAKAQYEQQVSNLHVAEQQVETAKVQIDISEASVDQAQSKVNETEADIEKNKAEWERQQNLLPQRATSQKSVERAKASYLVAIEQRKSALAGLAQAKSNLANSKTSLASAEASLRKAVAMVREGRSSIEQAELNLAFTELRSPVTGYVTNLTLRIGSQAVANQPQLSVIDTESFWIEGFFKETQIGRLHPGDEALVTLMGYPRRPLEGVVESIGWGIAQQDGSVGYEMLPSVDPTFDWIRLAQRLPVRVKLDDVPEDIRLRLGVTASVLIRSESDLSR